MRRAEKVEAVQELEGDLRRATVAVLADYRGLTAGQMTRLRKAVRDADGRCRVAKNTLARRAIEESRRPSFEPLLHGPVAMILGFRDPVAIAKLAGSARAPTADGSIHEQRAGMLATRRYRRNRAKSGGHDGL